MNTLQNLDAMVWSVEGVCEITPNCSIQGDWITVATGGESLVLTTLRFAVADSIRLKDWETVLNAIKIRLTVNGRTLVAGSLSWYYPHSEQLRFELVGNFRLEFTVPALDISDVVPIKARIEGIHAQVEK